MMINKNHNRQEPSKRLGKEKPPKQPKKKIIIAATVLFAIMAFLSDGTNTFNNFSRYIEDLDSTPVTASPLQNSTEDPEVTSENPITPLETSAPGCLRSNNGSTEPVACEVEHNGELFYSDSGCAPEAIYEYLGAVPGIDVLRQDLVATEIENVGCQLTIPSGVRFTGSMENAMSGNRSEFLRQCYDDKRKRNVGCNEVHTGEVVQAFAPDTASNANCLAAAEKYLGVDRSNFTDSLTVALDESGDSPRCLAEVKGDNILTATLRNITHSALPITADDGERK